LFERGPERWPGDFPDRLVSGAKNIQARTAAGHFGSPTALFDFRLEPDMSVLVGCGLGGTSLINANVALRPNRDVFDDPRWPSALRGNRDLLEPYFELAERWLGSNPYPADRPTPPKLAALEVGALAVGENATRPPINVTFSDGVSAGGVPQSACNGCGDCVARFVVQLRASSGLGHSPTISEMIPARRKVVRSLRYGPTICTPMGRPSSLIPAGTTVAGR
jgi:cholesterol oxidase